MLRARYSILALIALAGCQPSNTPVPWNVPTEYFIYDLPTQAALDLPELLASYGIEPLHRPVDPNEKVVQFKLTRIRSVDDLRKVQELLRDWSARNNTALDLIRASMVFTSVEGSLNSQVSLFGTATPGARVLVDIGTGEAVTPEILDGRWTFHVPSNALPAI